MASKTTVADLEQRVTQQDAKLDAILGALGGEAAPQPAQAQYQAPQPQRADVGDVPARARALEPGGKVEVFGHAKFTREERDGVSLWVGTARVWRRGKSGDLRGGDEYITAYINTGRGRPQRLFGDALSLVVRYADQIARHTGD